MQRFRFWAMFTGLILLVACAPQGSRVSTVTPVAVAPVASPAPGASQVLATTPQKEDEAWLKIIQEAKKEGRVVNYSFDMLGDVGLAVARAFKEKYGIILEPMASTALVSIERIKTEYRMGQHAADMMDGSTAGTNLIVLEGFSAELKDLPALKEQDAWLVSPNAWDKAGRQLITHVGTLGPLINTSLVRPTEEPKSWYDLLDPRWRGQIVVADPRTSTTMDMINVAFAERGILEKDYMERLGKQQIKFIAGGARGPIEALTRGEGKITLTTTSTAVFSIQEGAPIKALSPKEGLVSTPMGLTVLNKAPHPNATKLFINWLFSPEGATVYAKARGSMSIRKGVQDWTPEAAKTSLDKVYVMTLEESERSTKNRASGLMFKVLSPAK